MKFGYYNPKAIEILSRCEDLYRNSVGKGLLSIQDVIESFGLEYNKSSQINVGRGLKAAGFRKVRMYPDQRYMYTRDSEKELLESAHSTLAEAAQTALAKEEYEKELVDVTYSTLDAEVNENQIVAVDQNHLNKDVNWNNFVKQQVFGLLQEGQSVFLTGGAGSGKSYLLSELVNAMPNSIVLAPTGVAARLLNEKFNAKAQTIHSFFKFPLHMESSVNVKLPSFTERTIRNANAIFLDEVSMVNPKLLDDIERILRTVRGNELPFGGMGICLVGDLAQLPPVVPTKSSSGISEAEVLRKMGYDTTSIEGARVWSSFEDNTFELHGSRRIESSMEEDRLFYLLLTNMRQYLLGERNDIRNELNWLNKLCVEKELDSDFITLATTNDTVRQINDNKLAELSGKPFIYKGLIEGEWRNDIARAPLELTLKVGTKVICVMNDPMGQFVNGSIGRVLALDANSITVAIKSRGQEREVEINQVKWDNWQYQWDDGQGLIVKSVGTFSQFPVTLGYALTVNSAQGLTIESGVHFIPERIFTRNLPYVAISRVTSIADLSLSKPITLH